MDRVKSHNEISLLSYSTELEGINNQIRNLTGVSISFSHYNKILSSFNAGEFIIAYFDSKRNLKFKIPKGINKIDFKKYYNLSANVGSNFIQYIVNLKADRSFARDENETDVVKEVDLWFANFEQSLAELFNDPNLQLSFDRKNYNFNILETGKEPYNLNQLSDGYSAILSIITELLLRMESSGVKSYDVQGIVLIDELETHLHLELQKKVLPFLTNFFPKLQFVVTTHSPFVINSIENAVICDLEKRIVTEDLSGYSYDTLIESYFGADKYSIVLKQKVDEYEKLMSKEDLNEGDVEKLSELKRYIKDAPKFIADELAVKIQQIQLKTLNKKK
ncbi:AAA family ATPase [Chitinophaga sp.]|uniref:AAA family ATPase n=1 Tax=Chitinophaga sp. TaxID=1869181 RepID=UPI0031E21BA9